MLIDWLTARLPIEHLPRESWERLRALTDRVVRYCPNSGDVRWESSAWDSIRSDSHQIAFKVGGDAIWVQGSPARVIGSGDAVFGSGASSALDLVGCLRSMVNFVSAKIGVDLPTDPKHWKVSRVDVTGNLLLPDLAAVRVALRELRGCEGGRYRVSQQAGDTVYWSHRSALRSGKAYAKGPHLTYMTNQKTYTGYPYTPAEIDQANRLLRLELKLGAQWWRDKLTKHWTQVTPDDLIKEWNSYFLRMVGSADMKNEHDIKDKIYTAAEAYLPIINASRKVPIASSEGMAKGAYNCFLTLKDQGWEQARELFSKSAWYRHIKILHLAGLGDADISAGTVVQLRRKVIECQQVDSWSDIRKAA